MRWGKRGEGKDEQPELRWQPQAGQLLLHSVCSLWMRTLVRKKKERKEKGKERNTMKLPNSESFLSSPLKRCHWPTFDHILPLVVYQEITCYEARKWIFLFYPPPPRNAIFILRMRKHTHIDGWQIIKTIMENCQNYKVPKTSIVIKLPDDIEINFSFSFHKYVYHFQLHHSIPSSPLPLDLFLSLTNPLSFLSFCVCMTHQI